MTDGAGAVQRRIAQELGVPAHFGPAQEANRRSQFLTDLLAASGLRTLVVGISGGVDSATVGMLCRRAVRRRPSGSAALVAVRLPYGRQHDEADCEPILDAIEPDHVFTVDIQPASDAAMAGLTAAGLRFPSAARADHALGNIKARQRMIAQYAIAAALDGLDDLFQGVSGRRR